MKPETTNKYFKKLINKSSFFYVIKLKESFIDLAKNVKKIL